MPQVHVHNEKIPRQSLDLPSARPVYAEVLQAFHIAMPKISYLDNWYMALHTPAGYCFRVDVGDPTIYIAKLYAARRDAMDPQLKSLSITRSPTDEREVWIVHRTAPEITDGSQTDVARREEGDDELPRNELFPDG